MKSLPPDGDVEDTRVANIAELQQELRARSQRDRAYLIVLTGSNVGEMFRIESGESVIGRGQGTAVRLLDDGISRRHARVLQEGDHVTIEDLGLERHLRERRAGDRDGRPPGRRAFASAPRPSSSSATTTTSTRASSSRCTTPRCATR